MRPETLKIFSFFLLGISFIVMIYTTYKKYVDPLDKGFTLDLLITGFLLLLISLVLKNYEKQ